VNNLKELCKLRKGVEKRLRRGLVAMPSSGLILRAFASAVKRSGLRLSQDLWIWKIKPEQNGQEESELEEG